MAVPTKNAALADYSSNFNERIVESPETYHLTPAQAAAYTALHESFIESNNAVNAAYEAGIRSKPLIVARDTAKASLLPYARELYAFVQANRSVSDADKVLLGVHVKDMEPTPIPPPAAAPGLEVVSVNGRVVDVALFDPMNRARRRIPDGVDGAIVMSYVGETAPADSTAYSMQGPVSKLRTQVIFPSTLAAGTKVWLTAVWFNERKQMGPACTPVGTQINYGGSMPMSA